MKQHNFNSGPVLGASVGSAIEYFDFSVYGLLAGTLGPLFFPNQSGAYALLASLAIFGSAFVVRPLGGIFFGRLGDKRGRSSVLMATVLGMGICSTLIGLLPTVAQAGAIAPWLLLACRLLQGFFAGGEVSGATTYISESAPENKRGYYGAFNPAGVSIGLALAAAAVGLTNSCLTSDQMAAWGWRIPFISSLVLVAVGLRLRMRLEDTQEFKRMSSEGKIVKAPLGEVLREHKAGLLKTMGIAFGMTSCAYLGLVYFNIYLTRVNHYSHSMVFWLLAVAPLLASFAMPYFGGLSDRYGRKPLLLAGFAGYVVLTPAAMWVMSFGSPVFAALATLVAFLPFAVVQSVAYPSYAELFPARVRYTGVSLGFNFGSIFGGAATPFVSAWLVEQTGVTLSPAYYVMLCSLIGCVAVSYFSDRTQSASVTHKRNTVGQA